MPANLNPFYTSMNGIINPVVSILGCGWLGLPLAERLLQAGYSVKGSTTSADKKEILTAKGIRAYTVQFNPGAEGDPLDDFLQTDALVVNIPPKAGQQGDKFHPQQIRSLVRALSQQSIPYLIYVSSTSIYPDLNRTVTEETVTVPEQSAAPAFVEAENLLLELGNTTILRFGGLLGYDRIPGKYVAGKQGLTTGAVPVNYIHRDDGIRIIEALLQQPRPGQVFNVVSPQHPSREAVYRKTCGEFGYTIPTFAEPTSPTDFKVVSSQKLINTLSYSFQYPDPLEFYYQPVTSAS